MRKECRPIECNVYLRSPLSAARKYVCDYGSMDSLLYVL